MQSRTFKRIAKEIAERDKVVFDNLMDFEETHRIRTKTRLNFTIDKGTASRFRKYCKDKGLNMSAKMEQMMESMMSKK